MMSYPTEYIRKARRIHIGDCCGKPIKVGETYINFRGRVPKMDENDKQIGIEYVNFKFHNYDCGAEENEDENPLAEV